LSREAQYWWLRAMRTAQQGRRKAGAAPPPAVEFVAPSFDGEVRTVIPDGAGGYYVGGNFTSATDSVATYTTGYARLVRLTPAGLVDPAFSCPMGSSVFALALDSTGLYVGGGMSTAGAFGGATRLRCGRVRPFDDATPGAVDAWRPDFGSTVNALLLDGAGKLYVGGAFTATGGTGANYTSRTRNRIARITTGTAASCDDWRPDFGSTVNALLLDGAGKLYVGGAFGSTGGTGADYATRTRNGIARITTGAAASCDAWRPDFSSSVWALLLDGAGKLYVAGSFATTGGTGADYTSRTREGIARITTGAAATCDDYRPDPNGVVYGLLLDGAGKLYICQTGGLVGFHDPASDIPLTARNRLAAVNDGISSAPLAAWDPNANSTARGILQLSPTRVLVWGAFTSVANHVISGGSRLAVLEAA
jgi:hypothetical protein